MAGACWAAGKTGCELTESTYESAMVGENYLRWSSEVEGLSSAGISQRSAARAGESPRQSISAVGKKNKGTVIRPDVVVVAVVRARVFNVVEVVGWERAKDVPTARRGERGWRDGGMGWDGRRMGWQGRWRFVGLGGMRSLVAGERALGRTVDEAEGKDEET